MELYYPNKKSEKSILEQKTSKNFNKPWNNETNKIILGNNLDVLRLLLQKYNLQSKVDLIYIDPPFATNNTFTVSADRNSTVSRPLNGKVAYEDTLNGYKFIEFLRERLILARELLSDNGSIYLHIDYKIGHYVKIIMDEIFGSENFKNDITRIKCNPKNFNRKAYGNIKDLILFYSKTKDNIWNNPKTQYSISDIKKLFPKTDSNGRKYTTVPLHAPGETKSGETSLPFKGIYPPKGRHWRCSPSELEQMDNDGLIEWSLNNVPRKIIYADEKEGKKMQDIWDFKDPQYTTYPTEKNLDLLTNIIKASSSPRSLVLDFFCGSGTTLQAADSLGRQWIGIDQSLQAIKAAEKKLNKCNNLYSKGYDVLEIKDISTDK